MIIVWYSKVTHQYHNDNKLSLHYHHPGRICRCCVVEKHISLGGGRGPILGSCEPGQQVYLKMGGARGANSRTT